MRVLPETDLLRRRPQVQGVQVHVPQALQGTRARLLRPAHRTAQGVQEAHDRE